MAANQNKQTKIMSTSKRMSDMGAKNGEDMFDVLEDDMERYELLTFLKISLIKLFRIRPVTGPRSAVLDRGRTANLGPVTGPIRNNFINNIIVQCSLIQLPKFLLPNEKKIS